MPVWPITLPTAPLLDGFIETTPETIIRSEMDAGPAKVRNRTTAGVRKFSMAFILDKIQTATFDSFYLNDLSGGTNSFDFEHPRTGETLSLRLTKPPRYNAQNARYFRVSLEAESLPGVSA